jgi:flavodoxin
MLDIQKDRREVDLEQYEVLLLASGIYHGKIGEDLASFIAENDKKISEKIILLLTTSGTNNPKYIHNTIEKLEKYKIHVSAKFQCCGYDTWGPWRFMGGISKHRPNAEDLKMVCMEFSSWLE